MQIILVALAVACLAISYEARSIILISRPIQRVFNHNAARGGPLSPGGLVLVRRPVEMRRGPSPYDDDDEEDRDYDDYYDNDYNRGPCGACRDPCDCGGRNCGCAQSLPFPMMTGGGAMMGGMMPQPSGPDFKKNVKHITSPDGTQTDITTITGPGMHMETVHSSKVVKVVGKKPDTQAKAETQGNSIQGAKTQKEESPKEDASEVKNSKEDSDEEDEGALNPSETQKANKPTKKEVSENKKKNAKDSLMGDLQIKQKNEAEAEVEDEADEEDADEEEEEEEDPSEDEKEEDDEEEEDEQKQDDAEEENKKNKNTDHKAKNIPNKGHTVEDNSNSGVEDSKGKHKGKGSETKDRTNGPAPKKLKKYTFQIGIQKAPKQIKKEVEVEKPAVINAAPQPQLKSEEAPAPKKTAQQS